LKIFQDLRAVKIIKVSFGRPPFWVSQTNLLFQTFFKKSSQRLAQLKKSAYLCQKKIKPLKVAVKNIGVV
jgi:hypothetical protein